MIVRQVVKHDFKVDVSGKVKTYHANLLKQYVERSEKDEVTSVGAFGLAGVGIIEMDNSETEGILEVVLPPVESKEGRKDVNLGEYLNSQQR